MFGADVRRGSFCARIVSLTNFYSRRYAWTSWIAVSSTRRAQIGQYVLVSASLSRASILEPSLVGVRRDGLRGPNERDRPVGALPLVYDGRYHAAV
jgi:hypothetical protein